MSWGGTSCSNGGFGPQLWCGCVTLPPLIKRLMQVSPGQGQARVAAAEVKFGHQSISEGGRREREQGQYR